ncbi:thermosensitive gluconokinase [Gaeumannomyces tritici R3-111a-1]|uniref:Gluconokinase n=1 Tax=Gaeumannomyces tritici (strain R3-111a-1) TaxID=644352 RepID=J3P9V4_GAET3|nr:thermosensitive gluconokinase [Gaeumannomyces tritici R3-111a-1]EJT73440.1 thermosensitive gluconokinase [Gaeumannomyces tritici R3-111a-1]
MLNCETPARTPVPASTPPPPPAASEALAPPFANTPAPSSPSPNPSSPPQPTRAAMTLSADPPADTGAGATAAKGSPPLHIWIVSGPAGCGKSTVAEHLAAVLAVPYIEGDQYHTPDNVAKMQNGVPLNDADRWDWLRLLREEAVGRLDTGGDGSGSGGVVVTCSALKRKYRDVMRVAPYFRPRVRLHFIYLEATEEALLKRVAARENHYMGANMVHSQFEALEPPTADEVDVIHIDVGRPREAVKAAAERTVLEIMGQEA